MLDSSMWLALAQGKRKWHIQGLVCACSVYLCCLEMKEHVVGNPSSSACTPANTCSEILNSACSLELKSSQTIAWRQSGRAECKLTQAIQSVDCAHESKCFMLQTIGFECGYWCSIFFFCEKSWLLPPQGHCPLRALHLSPVSVVGSDYEAIKCMWKHIW